METATVTTIKGLTFTPTLSSSKNLIRPALVAGRGASSPRFFLDKDQPP